jgi:hypothetical protein
MNKKSLCPYQQRILETYLKPGSREVWQRSSVENMKNGKRIRKARANKDCKLMGTWNLIKFFQDKLERQWKVKEQQII